MAQAIEQHIDQLVQTLQSEGILDEQFEQLMSLQDETNPNFVAEVVQLYFEDSARKIDKIEQMLSTSSPDFEELDQLVHQFKVRLAMCAHDAGVRGYECGDMGHQAWADTGHGEQCKPWCTDAGAAVHPATRMLSSVQRARLSHSGTPDTPSI
eukprot:353222-Chlamydomonas_euryale.AAC.16